MAAVARSVDAVGVSAEAAAGAVGWVAPQPEPLPPAAVGSSLDKRARKAVLGLDEHRQVDRRQPALLHHDPSIDDAQGDAGGRAEYQRRDRIVQAAGEGGGAPSERPENPRPARRKRTAILAAV